MTTFYLDSAAGSNTSPYDTWAKAATTLAAIIAVPLAAGDTVYMASTHAESSATTLTFTLPGTLASPNIIICADKTSGAPPTTTATGGSIETTGNTNIVLTGFLYGYGFTLQAGSSTGGSNVALNNLGGRLLNCSFVLAGSGATPFVQLGNANGCSLTLESATFKFGNVAQRISLVSIGGSVEIIGGSIDGSGAAITGLFTVAQGCAEANVYGFDASAMAVGANVISSTVNAVDINMAYCKMPSSWSGSPNATSTPGWNSRVTLDHCDSGATNYAMSVTDTAGTINESTAVFMTGGATDGTTPISWILAANANAEYPMAPLKSEWRSVWVDTTSSKTLTWNYVADTNVSAGQGAGASSAFRNNQVWIEALYMGSSASPLATFASSAPATPLTAATDNAAGSASWTTFGLTTPKIGCCTLTFAAAMKGPMLARICLGAASKAIYADPAPTFDVAASRSYQIPGGPYVSETGGAGGSSYARSRVVNAGG